MIWRCLLLTVSLFGQKPEPVFSSWHAFEYAVHERPNRGVIAQVHFRTRDHFSTFSLLRFSVYGSQRLPKGWTSSAGYLRQDQELELGEEWARQHRVFASLGRPFRRGRIQHSPRVQYDYLFGMPTPAYGRVRMAWQTEWIARLRPYAGAEEFMERAGVQRFRPRAGVRFSPARYLDTDLVYIYDRIYRRGLTNRHILQTTFSFHRPNRD